LPYAIIQVKSGGIKSKKSIPAEPEQTFILIKTLFAKAIEGNCGGEENRTPVQTYSSKAFYMFICSLIVGEKQESNTPIIPLAESS
jgi:hypothetical protein